MDDVEKENAASSRLRGRCKKLEVHNNKRYNIQIDCYRDLSKVPLSRLSCCRYGVAAIHILEDLELSNVYRPWYFFFCRELWQDRGNTFKKSQERKERAGNKNKKIKPRRWEVKWRHAVASRIDSRGAISVSVVGERKVPSTGWMYRPPEKCDLIKKCYGPGHRICGKHFTLQRTKTYCLCRPCYATYTHTRKRPKVASDFENVLVCWPKVNFLRRFMAQHPHRLTTGVHF